MTPRMHPIVERPVLSVDAAQNSREWEDLYARAETLLGTSTSTFDRSIRHTLVLRTLQAAFPAAGADGEADATVPRVFVPLPVAAERVAGSEEIHWHATDRILADIFTAPEKRARFTLLTEHRLTRLALDGRDAGNSDHVKIAAAEVRDMRIGRDSYIQAKVYIVAGGTVATPQVIIHFMHEAERLLTCLQVLYNSGFAGLSEEDRASSLIPNLVSVRLSQRRQR
jgi:pyranose oxidase